LRPLCDEFFRLANADLSRDEAIHELRLAGKRLRYALELASATIPEVTRRRLYDELSDLQDRLGGLCDAMVAVQRMHEWLGDAQDAAVRKELRAAQSRQQAELASRKRRFLRWWTARRRERMRRAWGRALVN
jgi:CHAD domain-containing protein